MSLDLNTLAVDTDKEEEGVWVEVGEGASLLIAHWGNKAFTAAMRRYVTPKQHRLKNMPEHEADALMAKVVSETILLDWKGVSIDGAEVPYSRAKAVELLTSRKYRSFRELVEGLAKDDEQFRLAEMEEDMGNSSDGSGSS